MNDLRGCRQSISRTAVKSAVSISLCVVFLAPFAQADDRSLAHKDPKEVAAPSRQAPVKPFLKPGDSAGSAAPRLKSKPLANRKKKSAAHSNHKKKNK